MDNIRNNSCNNTTFSIQENVTFDGNQTIQIVMDAFGNNNHASQNQPLDKAINCLRSPIVQDSFRFPFIPKEQRELFEKSLSTIFQVQQTTSWSKNQIHAVGQLIQTTIDKDNSTTIMEGIDQFIESTICVRAKFILYAYYASVLIKQGKIDEAKLVDKKCLLIGEYNLPDRYMDYYLQIHSQKYDSRSYARRDISLVLLVTNMLGDWKEEKLVAFPKELLAEVVSKMPAKYRENLPKFLLKKDLFGLTNNQLLQFFTQKLKIQDCFFIDANNRYRNNSREIRCVQQFKPHGLLVQNYLLIEDYEVFLRGFFEEKKEIPFSLIRHIELQDAVNLLKKKGFSPENTQFFYSLAFVQAVVSCRGLRRHQTPVNLLNYYREIVEMPLIDRHLNELKSHLERSNFQEASNSMKEIIHLNNESSDVNNFIQSIADRSIQRHLFLMYSSELCKYNNDFNYSTTEIFNKFKSSVNWNGLGGIDWKYFDELTYYLTDIASQGSSTVILQVDALCKNILASIDNRIYKAKLIEIKSIILKTNKFNFK